MIPAREYVDGSVRVFVVEPDGTTHFGEMSAALEQAVDLMVADRVDIEEWMPILVAAEKDGEDVVAFARHCLKLREGVR